MLLHYIKEIKFKENYECLRMSKKVMMMISATDLKST
jgi:hypothetical protein